MTDRRLSRGRHVSMIAILLLAGCTSAEEPPFPPNLNVGATPSSPGWNLRDDAGNRTGFDHALTEWLGKELDFTPVEVDVLTENREHDLRDRRVELVIANYSITDDRLDEVEIVGPYMITHQGVMVRKGDVGEYRSLDDLAGKRVCATNGSTSLDQIENDLGFKVTKVPKKVYEECRQALHDNEVDVVSTDQLMLYGIAGADDGVAVIPDITFGKEERYGVGLPLGDKVRCELIREKLRKFLADELWEQFFREHFPNLPTRTDKPGDDPLKTYKPDPDRLRECRSAPSTTR